MSSASASALTVALRNGATCVLHEGALTIGENTFPLAALVSATLVADMSVPVAPGMPPAPAVALRLSDGSAYFLTPVEQGDAMRLLQAVHAARPDLATPGPGLAAPPPGPAYGPGYGPGYGAGYPPPPGYGYQQAGAYPPPSYSPYAQAEGDRTLAGICHLSVFFAPVILPLIVWLAMRQSHPYASQQAKQAFWFHLFIGMITFAAVVVVEGIFFATFVSTAVTMNPNSPNPTFPIGQFGLLFGMYGVLGVFGLLNIIFSVIAAVKAFKGEPYHYPLLGWL